MAGAHAEVPLDGLVTYEHFLSLFKYATLNNHPDGAGATLLKAIETQLWARTPPMERLRVITDSTRTR